MQFSRSNTSPPAEAGTVCRQFPLGTAKDREPPTPARPARIPGAADGLRRQRPAGRGGGTVTSKAGSLAEAARADGVSGHRPGMETAGGMGSTAGTASSLVSGCSEQRDQPSPFWEAARRQQCPRSSCGQRQRDASQPQPWKPSYPKRTPAAAPTWRHSSRHASKAPIRRRPANDVRLRAPDIAAAPSPAAAIRKRLEQQFTKTRPQPSRGLRWGPSAVRAIRRGGDSAAAGRRKKGSPHWPAVC